MFRLHGLVPRVFVVLSVALSGSAVAEPVIHFAGEQVTVGGLLPGSEAVLLGVGRGVAGFVPFQVSFAEVLSADAEGVAVYTVEEPAPAASVWVAVAASDGSFSLAAPEGSELREITFPANGLPATLRHLNDDRSELQVLWVRPTGEAAVDAGAWTARIVDGSELDGDSVQDRRLGVALDRLAPVGISPPPPSALTAGDVLVGVDPESLEIYAVRLVR